MNPATVEFQRARDHLLSSYGDLPRARAFPRPEVGQDFSWVADWFDVIAQGNDAIALRVVDLDQRGEVVADTALSFAELAERSQRVARWLRAAGVRRGDRMLLMLPNRVELWECLLAAFRLGCAVIPASVQLTPDDLADRLERGGVGHVVAEAGLTPKLARLSGGRTCIAVGGPVPGWLDYQGAYAAEPLREAVRTRPEEPSLIYFTSGSTNRPKLVGHTSVSYPIGHLSTMYWIGIRPGDVHLNISSPGWGKHAWSNLFAPWNAQATVMVVNQPRFAARPLLEMMSRYAVTTFCAPPTVWRSLLQEDLTQWPISLREAVAAGEPLNGEVVRRVREAWGVTVRDGYGQTETTAQIGTPPGMESVDGALGWALPGYEVALLDPNTGVPIPDGPGEGEICLPLASRPLGLMSGYLGNSEATAYCTRGGYYHTGDIATRDADGLFRYTGRGDDLFKASDYRISPFELESVLLRHPAVADAAVVPSPEPLRLAVPKAYVALAAGYRPEAETAQLILAHARDQLAPYKRIRRIEFAELPKTVTGKIQRTELRRREEQRSSRSAQEWWEEDFQN
ncbi:AMP-binding protein [Microbispora sp. H10670]|uniref:AMP-binding protein n=1 Tax=Microbispora sp. H10670 TaxID=2729108 RepID=UPI001601DEB4|nr:AMP-binding protein [Microbispora sp. H10670]